MHRGALRPYVLNFSVELKFPKVQLKHRDFQSEAENQESGNSSMPVTSMLVTDVGDQISWWQVCDVGDRFRMLATDFIH